MPRRSRASLIAGLVLAVAVAGCAPAAGPAAGTGAGLDPAFEAFIDKYLREVRGVGGDLPSDMSEAAFAQSLETQKRLLGELEAFDASKLTVEQTTDHRFLLGILRSNIREAETVQRWRQDPRRYVETNPITFKMQGDHRHPEERGRALVNDMKTLQARIRNGKINLTQYIPQWLQYANARIDGSILHFQDSIPTFAARLSPDLRGELLAETERAIEALRGFRTFVNDEWTKRPEGDFRIGADLYNYLHEHRHQLPASELGLRTIARGSANFTRVPEYHDWGWKQYQIVERALEAKAAEIDPSTPWLQQIKRMKRNHPFAEQLVYEGMKVARLSRDWTIKNDLVTIPWEDDDHIMVASDPSLSASQWWGFGPGYLPAGHQSKKMAWPIIPIHPDWSDDVAEENLTEKDWSFMYAIGPHEAYPGHHLMRLYRHRNPRKLRVYESSYSDQGWCYYVEWELTPDPDYGYFPKDKQDLYSLEVLRLKLWRMGRVIIDSGLHTGRMSWEDAVKVESERTGFVRRGAEINIDGIMGGGTGTAAPTVGYFQWMQLRDDYFNKMRELDQKGTLKDFHDRVYNIGFIPVTLVRDELFQQLDREFGPPAPRG
ncbi:MAG: DUF885 family protein [Acidobacteria bacterium]|nr:DUF885 family protein [Acidobacteriota bacterium]